MRSKSKKVNATVAPDELRAEYDFDYSKAVRGKHYKRLLKEGANVVVLDPDVAKAFRSSAAVNDALRSLLRVAEATRRRSSPAGSRPAAGRRWSERVSLASVVHAYWNGDSPEEIVQSFPSVSLERV
jgi:hypothetical protein